MRKLIVTSRGYVAGYNSQHMIVSFASDKSYAKRFKNEAAAVRFIVRYVDAGFGLNSEDQCRVVDA